MNIKPHKKDKQVGNTQKARIKKILYHHPFNWIKEYRDIILHRGTREFKRIKK